MRCEDFPCCGHYEASTGETFCYEATRTPAQRKADELRAQADRIEAEAEREDARSRAWAAASERDHDDERCDNGNDEMCEECFREAEECEADYAYAVRHGDVPDPYDY